jgi:hypothetical protein
MTTGHDGNNLVLTPGRHLRAQGQLLPRRPFDQGDVDTAQRSDDLRRVAVRCSHQHLRVAGMEVGNQVRQQVTGGCGTGTDTQGTTLQATHGLTQCLGLAEGFTQALGMGQQLLAGCRQPHPPAGTLIQRLAKSLLQQLELAGHRRLRQVQRLGRMADVAVLGDSGKRYQLFWGHDSKISAKRIFAIPNYDFL